MVAPSTLAALVDSEGVARRPAWKISVWNGTNCHAMMTTSVKNAHLGASKPVPAEEVHVGVDPKPSQTAELREKDVLPHQAQAGSGHQ